MDSGHDPKTRSGSNSNPQEEGVSFNPSRITAETFQRLLSCYTTTAEQVQRRKAMRKLQPKPEKGSKHKVDKATLSKKTNFNASDERQIRDETANYLELDLWRYKDLPRLVQQRKKETCQSTGEVKEGAYLTKEELCRIMEWKLKHGVSRPMLLGMVKSNQDSNVLKSTSAALSSLPTADPILAPEQAFPKESLDALGPLRGVGPATASLILSIATIDGPESQQVPFYSDDVYFWLCAEDYPEGSASPETVQLISNGGTEAARSKEVMSDLRKPNGELNVKYNIAEYRQLWNAYQEMRRRLSDSDERDAGGEAGKAEADETGAMVSMADIEKVAYVLRNIAVSGFYPGIDAQEILQMTDEQVKTFSASLTSQRPVDGGQKENEMKRKWESKREEEAEGGMPAGGLPTKRTRNTRSNR